MESNTTPLLRDWLRAKGEEEAARSRRVEIEKQLEGCLEVPAEGSKTHKIDGFKVTVTQPVTRKLDEAEWGRVYTSVPEDMRPVKTRIEADPAGCKYLANNEPEIWSKIASAFETKPGKIGYKVEGPKDGN